MKLMFEKTERHQGIYIQKVFHGKFDRISRTCSLVSRGAPGPAVRTGRPVTESRRMADFARRPCWGTRTILPSFTAASSVSPARSPSFRRIGPGRTTCPLLEMRVCTVRISYHAGPAVNLEEQGKGSLKMKTRRAAASYSCRSAASGSIRDARLAGAYPARIAALISTTPAATRVPGSFG